MNQNTFRTLVFVLLSGPATLSFAAGPVEPTPKPKPVANVPFSGYDTLSGFFLGKDNFPDKEYDAIQKAKTDDYLPLSIGGDHWFHIDRDHQVYGNGYGVPNERGTYHYDVSFDPTFTFKGDGFVQEIGAHIHERFRDGDEKLRSFYKDTVWSYEAYAYAKTDFGEFKAGQILLNFGYVWDNSWWEGVPYFDGYRFNPAYGAAWEKDWKLSKSVTLATDLQYFVADDRVSGAIAGADAESSLAGERNTFNLRVAPTWKINADTTLVVGTSVLTREVHHPDKFGAGVLDDRQTAFAEDVAVTWKNLTLFSQYTDSFGVISPARYVSGGPSDRQNSFEVGSIYKFGPIAPHLNFSYGWDHHPSGHQFIVNPGITFTVSKSLTLYTEYVRWDVINRTGAKATFDDGFELVLSWNL